MKTRSHFFTVHSLLPPVVEFDIKSSAYYIHFAKAGTPVAKTISRDEAGLLNLDLDSKGRVIGIEAIGARELEITKIAAKAKVDISEVDLSRQKFRAAGTR